MIDHLITRRVDSTCRMPPAHPVGEECHIVGTTCWCEIHCPHCHPPPQPKKPKPEKSESLF
jgi:hypothetical protein